jgi:4-amino-4-deoxychorismate lyase
MSSPAQLALAKIRWGCQPQLAGIKHLNRLEQVLASVEREAAGVDEVVMLNQAGQVISVSAANLFILEGDTLLTPQLTECGVRGTRRHLIIEQLAPALGLQVRQEKLTVAQVESAKEVFYCNALVGLRPVGSFEAGQWESHNICSALHTLLCEGAQ